MILTEFRFSKKATQTQSWYY